MHATSWLLICSIVRLRLPINLNIGVLLRLSFISTSTSRCESNRNAALPPSSYPLYDHAAYDSSGLEFMVSGAVNAPNEIAAATVHHSLDVRPKIPG